MFLTYATTNLALVVLGYEAATARTIPRWSIIVVAALVSIVTAFQWSRALARAYRREDRTFEMFERLLQSRKAESR